MSESSQHLAKEECCPICNKLFLISEIETHANRCLFLNSSEVIGRPKKRRTPSPTFATGSREKSPRITTKTKNHKTTTTSPSPVKKFNFKSLPVQNNKQFTLNANNEAATSSSNLSKSENELQTNITTDLSFLTPLANQVAPKCLQEFFGQNHVLGQNTVLRSLLEKGDVPNMILWGPPGCGKTSLAGVIKEMCKANSKKFKFVSFCAANCGVKDVQNVVSASKLEQKFGRRTILFMDEVHRFNKKQQDTFLAHVEKGDITLIGATTENPSFSINSALLSRCRVIVLEKLETNDLIFILERAVKRLGIDLVGEDLSNSFSCDNGFAIERSALEWLADTSDGDARIALSSLQLVLQHSNTPGHTAKIIDIEDIKNGIKKSHLLYDRKGEEHYNIISAMHKSIRGSDPNAALYWTTRMIVSGEDPLFIARRMVRAASEDIGNADPQALQLAVATMQGCQLIGMPEADVLLAQCAIYLARAPKSREADSALQAAKRTISECKGVQPSVPMHIRNAPTKLMKELGYGRLANGARYSFMPAGLEDVRFF